MKPFVIASLLAGIASPALAGGGCLGKVLLPPVETTRSERVLVAPAREERRYVPAQVVRENHAVLVRLARVERFRVAPVWRLERSWVGAPGPVRWMRGPDHYADVTERVLLQPAHYAWERRGGPVVSAPPEPGQTVVTPTGVVLCKVWCPAHYGAVVRHVRVGPGRPYAVHTVVHREVMRRVLVRPGGVEVRRIPAEYRYVSSTRVLAPAHWEARRYGAQYGWRTERAVQDGGSAYAPVVCGGPLSRPAMARMQSSLATQGYDPGPVDGIGRPETYAALHRFQVDHRLAAGQVTVESARALGVVP